MLRIRLLGELTVERNGHDVASPARRHGQLLLAYLALDPGLHTRAAISALLWPDVLDSSARSSLRSALTSIRQALGQDAPRYLLAGRERIGLAGADEVWVDALEFRTLAARGELEAALELATGELLRGFDEEWVYAARSEHRIELDALLSALAERAEQRGDLTAALDHARRRVALDPLAEPANRDLMRLLTATGDRASALALYTRLSDRFRRELRTLPSRETRAVADEARGAVDGSAGPGGQAQEQALPLPAALACAPSGPFVGRSDALRELEDALDRARTSGRRVALVGGEPGIGKTRLLTEFARQAHDAGASVLFASCQRAPAVPYEPFVETVGHYARTLPVERLRHELPAAAGELRALVPELDERAGDDLPLPLAGDPDGEENRLCRAVRATLLAAAKARLVVLAFDDLQWADAPTVRLLEYLIAATEPSRLLVLVAYRDTELPDFVRSLLARARRLPEAIAVALEELDVAAVAKLMGEDALTAASAAALQARTRGNPLFVEALLDGGSVSGGSLLPERVSDVLFDEVSQLSRSARDTLTIAAAVGDEFTYELLLRSAGGDELTTLDALDEAVGARVIHELPHAVGRYAFRHPLMREGVYESLTQTRRAHLHQRVGHALEELYGDDPAPPVRLIADQLLRAGTLAPPGQAAGYAARAGQDAARRHCHEDAAELYAQAVESLNGRGAGDQRLRGDLLIALGHARRRTGNAAGVRAPFEEAAALGRELENPGMTAEAALGLCSVPFFPGEDAVDSVAVGLLGQALERLPEEARKLRARLFAQLARELYFDADREGAQRAARSALELGRETDDPAALGDAIDASHLLLTDANDARGRLALADEIIALGERQEAPDMLVRGRTRRAVDLLEVGDLNAMRGEGAQLERLADQFGQSAYRWWPQLWRATQALLTGRLDEGERLAHQAFETGAAAFGEAAELELQAQIFWLHFERDTIAELSPEAGALATRYSFMPVWQCVRALVALRRDDLDTARSVVHDLAADGFAQLRQDASWMLAATLLAEVCAGVGDLETAPRLFGTLAPYAGRWAVTASGSVCLCPVSRPLALLAATTGGADAAERHFADAHGQAQAASAVTLVARLERERASLLIS